MADVFISYAGDDSARARLVAEALRASGWDVWLNADSRIGELRAESRRQLESAKCVLVLWSEKSVQSDWVADEADSGKHRKVLVQALLDQTTLPFGFRYSACIDLSRWQGNGEADEFRTLKVAIGKLATPTTLEMFPGVGAERRVRADDGLPKLRIDAPLPMDAPAKPAPASTSDARSIFLCYRRQDTQGHTGRLRDRLVADYGRGNVFMDVDDVPFGVDFVDHVEAVLGSCAVMLVMIGPSWLTIADRKGRRKLEQTDDLVRVEIAAALKRRIPVIPVLIEDAIMPDSDDVPEEIRGLTRRNAIELTHRRWDSDVQRVLAAVKGRMDDRKSS